jgi:hypothetical protein
MRAIEATKNQKPGFLNSLSEQQIATKVINAKFMELLSFQTDIIADLILTASRAHGQLQQMKERVQAIRNIAQRENITISQQNEQILASIWTALGANKAEIKVYEYNLQLLGDLDQYSDQAKAHIADALFSLETMQAQLKDLRQRTAQPSVVGMVVPAEVHIQVLMDSAQRFKQTVQYRRLEGKDLRTIGGRSHSA